VLLDGLPRISDAAHAGHLSYVLCGTPLAPRARVTLWPQGD
jgi:hypothetical protein